MSDGGNEGEWIKRSKANAAAYAASEAEFLGQVDKQVETRQCRFCGRDRAVPCMNTRDMDPDDGLNNNAVCNAALAARGGGERGFVMRRDGSGSDATPAALAVGFIDQERAMSIASQDHMFEWAERQRALAMSMTNAELARALLDDIISSVGAAESEYAVSTDDYAAYARERGILREAAYRLAGLREYEKE